MYDKIQCQDIAIVIKQLRELRLQHKTYFITGATGLIGSYLAKILLEYKREYDNTIVVICAIRDINKAKEIFSKEDFDEIIFWESDLMNIDPSKQEEIPDVDVCIHAASVTKSLYMINRPVDTVKTSVLGTLNVLDMMISKHVKCFLYISSMEVYGTMDNDKPVHEDQMGYINPLNIRSNYPEGKRICENICIAYSHQYNIEVKIARLAQTFGPGIMKTDSRIFAQLAKCAINDENIVLHTNGESQGNYVYIRDMAYALFLIIKKGKNQNAYNVVNEDSHISIRNMAEMVCRDIAHNKIQVVYDIPDDNIYGYAQRTMLNLSGEKLKSLGWTPQVALAESYRRLISSLTG